MAKNTAFDKSMEWLSRTITIILFMLLPGVAGAYLDDRFETGFLAPTGVVIGMVFAMSMLLFLSKKLAPPARGKPIPFEDEDGNDPWDADPDTQSSGNKDTSVPGLTPKNKGT